jgi:hypothetical protein
MSRWVNRVIAATHAAFPRTPASRRDAREGEAYEDNTAAPDIMK